MQIDWTAQLLDQLTWHWGNQLRPRFDGLTDEEYFWEPVAGCWSVRPAGESPIGIGSGRYTADYEFPQPEPAPVTTIAWRLSHLIVGVLGMRVATHFDGPPIHWESYDYPATAQAALAELDAAYARWVDGVRGLGEDGLAQPCGPGEGPFAEYPMAALALHINREAIHHGAEIALLRDLYAHR